MRAFNITVNGKTYQVQAEETTGGIAATVPAAPAAPIAVQASNPATAPVVAPAPVAAPAPAAAPAKPAPAITGGERIKSPMPGTIISVKVSEGQSVKKHDVLIILEAMKMENEIVAPRDGVVAQIPAGKGASVNTGDTLVVIQ
ncbi:MAG: biotin/lipoyl-binding protein [Oscillospiraceae bacterium]|jgi:glutaconyl-CoA decarboxylase|nr:biotin/lipoyl-binding protein [Oscillospiraceae bacterium]